MEKSREVSDMARSMGLIRSFNCPWTSSQVTSPCGGTVVLAVSSLHSIYPEPSVARSPPIIPMKVTKLNLLALSESCAFASIVRARGMGCADGPGLCDRPNPTVGSTTPTPSTGTMRTLLLAEEGRLGAKQAKTANVPPEHRVVFIYHFILSLISRWK